MNEHSKLRVAEPCRAIHIRHARLRELPECAENKQQSKQYHFDGHNDPQPLYSGAGVPAGDRNALSG
jgi:hypothetical protein